MTTLRILTLCAILPSFLFHFDFFKRQMHEIFTYKMNFRTVFLILAHFYISLIIKRLRFSFSKTKHFLSHYPIVITLQKSPLCVIISMLSHHESTAIAPQKQPFRILHSTKALSVSVYLSYPSLFCNIKTTFLFCHIVKMKAH